jgi:hypothetical protein
MDPRSFDSHYDALQVGPEASADEVRQAWRRLAQQHHPDRSEGGDDGGTMARINQAYEVLSDPHQRSEYDFKLRVAAMRAARGRPQPFLRMSLKLWLMLLGVAALTVFVLGWVAWRVLAPPPPAAMPPVAAQPAGPTPDDPLPLIPARSIQPWTPPAAAVRPARP